MFMPVLSPDTSQVFDLASDPQEQQNLLQSDPQAGDSLRALIDEYLENAKSPWGVAPREVELDEMRLEQLRALGYVIK